jgi:hypothetical protein
MITKRLLAFVVLFICGASLTVGAQHIFSKGDQAVNLGLGIGSYYGGDGYTGSIPPLSVSYEKGIIDGLLDGKGSIGVGGYLGYSANKWETSINGDTYGYKYSYMMIGARGAFHYQFVDKLDSYGGLMLGYNVVGSKYFGTDLGSYKPEASSASGIGYSAFVGARYHFSDKFAAYGELGYGISALELGISIRL